MGQPHERRGTNSVSNVSVPHLLVDGLANRGERYPRVAREFRVVESDQRDLARDVQAAPVELVEGSQGHEIVCARDGVDVVGPQSARVEQGRDRARAGLAREIAGDHVAAIDRQLAVGQGTLVAAEARLRLIAAVRAGHEGDLATAMRVHQVLDRGVHAGFVVHQHGGDTLQRHPQANPRDGSEARHEVGQFGQRRVVPDDMGADEERVHAVGPDEVVHEALGIAQVHAQHAAGNCDEIQAPVAGRALGRDQDARLELVVIGIGQQPQARTATARTGFLLCHDREIGSDSQTRR
jgi:hypothetical protein